MWLIQSDRCILEFNCLWLLLSPLLLLEWASIWHYNSGFWLILLTQCCLICHSWLESQPWPSIIWSGTDSRWLTCNGSQLGVCYWLGDIIEHVILIFIDYHVDIASEISVWACKVPLARPEPTSLECRTKAWFVFIVSWLDSETISLSALWFNFVRQSRRWTITFLTYWEVLAHDAVQLDESELPV